MHNKNGSHCAVRTVRKPSIEVTAPYAFVRFRRDLSWGNGTSTRYPLPSSEANVSPSPISRHTSAARNRPYPVDVPSLRPLVPE